MTFLSNSQLAVAQALIPTYLPRESGLQEEFASLLAEVTLARQVVKAAQQIRDDFPSNKAWSPMQIELMKALTAYTAVQQTTPVVPNVQELVEVTLARRMVEALELILPLAKGYAAEHRVGSNQTYVSQAEDALTAYTAAESPLAAPQCCCLDGVRGAGCVDYHGQAPPSGAVDE